VIEDYSNNAKNHDVPSQQVCITFFLNHTITNEISNLLMIVVHILFVTTKLKIPTFYLTAEEKTLQRSAPAN
jgi:hypothetical protein